MMFEKFSLSKVKLLKIMQNLYFDALFPDIPSILYPNFIRIVP